MKRTAYILLSFFFIIVVIACGKYNDVIYQAEAIMEDDPEAALSLLTTIEEPLKDLSYKNYALYQVLLAQACHKCDKDLSKCVGINSSIQYYRTSKDSIRAAKAYFYGGLVSEQMNNTPQAAEYFLKAKDLLTGSNEYKYQYMVRYYLGDIYDSQWLREDQLEMAREAVCYAQLYESDYNLPLSYNKLGKAFASIGNNDSALYYQHKALSFCKNDSEILLSHIYYHLWFLYREENQINQMIAFKDSLHKVIPDDPLTNSVIGDTYFQMNKPDSSIIYLKRSLACDDLYILAESNLLLADVYESLNKHDSISYYLRQYSIVRDSIDKQMRALAIIETKNLNALNRYSEENLSLKENDLAKSQAIVVLCIIFFVITIISILLYIRYRQKRTRLAQEKKDLLSKQEKENLIRETKIMEIREECYEMLNIHSLPQLEGNSIYLSDADWEIIYKNANAVFDNFTDRLKEKHPSLSVVDIRLCCLMKMKMRPSMMANILGIASASISKRKYRIAIDKIGLNDGKSLDNYIRTF